VTPEVTADGEVVVPREVAGALAALIRWALPRVRADWGSAVPCHRELTALEPLLAQSSRAPLPQSARSDGSVGHDVRAMVTISVANRRTGIPSRTLRHMCSRGQVRGVELVGGTWLIPEVWVANRSTEAA
jgi:hypothetical protein